MCVLFFVFLRSNSSHLKIQTAAVRELTDIIHLTAGVRPTSTGNPTLQGPSSLHCCRALNYRVHVQNALCIGGPAGMKNYSKRPWVWGAGVWWGPGRQRWTGPYSCPLGKPLDRVLTGQSPTGQSVGSLPLLDLKVLVHTRRHRHGTWQKQRKWWGTRNRLHDRLTPESNSRIQIWTPEQIWRTLV